MSTSIILATDNPGKIKELRLLLSPIHCVSQSEYNIPAIEETGLTFIENALIKARHACTHSKQPALADDSGLVVPALHGAPGIYSARYAGKHATSQQNIELLLQRMHNCTSSQREAYFYCVIVMLQHASDPTPSIATGLIRGVIATEPQGNDGFGYDPIFYVPEYQCTMAELPLEVKNKMSHRALALHQLKAQFR